MATKLSRSMSFETCDDWIMYCNSDSTSAVGPRTLRKAFLAWLMWLRSTKLLGLSGISKAPIVMIAAGTVARPRDMRHPHGCGAVPKFMQLAATTPMLLNNWKPVLNAPRHLAGAISDRYTGVACVHLDTTSKLFLIITSFNSGIYVNLK